MSISSEKCWSGFANDPNTRQLRSARNTHCCWDNPKCCMEAKDSMRRLRGPLLLHCGGISRQSSDCGGHWVRVLFQGEGAYQQSPWLERAFSQIEHWAVGSWIVPFTPADVKRFIREQEWRMVLSCILGYTYTLRGADKASWVSLQLSDTHLLSID